MIQDNQMTNKIYGYIFALLFTSSATGIPIPSKEPDFSGSEPKPVCHPISFRAKGWVSVNNYNATDYPIVSGNKVEELILLPDDRYGAATAAIYRNTVTPPYEVEFEFNTFDDNGGYFDTDIWHSGDGISFFFLKNGTFYDTPEHGHNMGQSYRGGGLAVSFPMYDRRRVTLSLAGGKTLVEHDFKQAYSHGRWIPVSVTVKTNSVTVKSGDKQLFKYHLDTRIYQKGNSFGFSAGSGWADARHEIRGLCIRKL